MWNGHWKRSGPNHRQCLPRCLLQVWSLQVSIVHYCLDHNLFFIHFLQLLYQVQPVRYIVLNRWSKQALLSSGWLISTRPPLHFITIISLLLIIMMIIIRITQRGLPLTVVFARWQLCRRRVRPRWGGYYICLKIVTLESHENLEGNRNYFYSLFHS